MFSAVKWSVCIPYNCDERDVPFTDRSEVYCVVVVTVMCVLRENDKRLYRSTTLMHEFAIKWQQANFQKNSMPPTCIMVHCP